MKKRRIKSIKSTGDFNDKQAHITLIAYKENDFVETAKEVLGDYRAFLEEVGLVNEEIGEPPRH